MWEYEVQFIDTGEIELIYGYNFIDACAKADIDIDEVECLSYEYID